MQFNETIKMSLENTYFDDVVEDKSDLFLSRTLFALTVASSLAMVIQLYLVFSIITSCSTIYGLTISGKVFETDSYSCPNPTIPFLYERGG